MLKLRIFSAVIITILFLTFAAENLNAQSGSIKYVYTIDYPVGKKEQYLEWVKTIVSTLQKPPELISISSYDNYFIASPHRTIEFEFANNMDAAKYFDNPEIRNVVSKTIDHGITRKMIVLNKRGDYMSGEAGKGNVKYVYSLDYGVGNRTPYLDRIKTIAQTLQTQKEIKRITSYDNYFNSSPNRVIEFEFDSMEAAVKYFAIPEIKSVIEKSVNMSINHEINVLSLRSDYNKNK